MVLWPHSSITPHPSCPAAACDVPRPPRAAKIHHETLVCTENLNTGIVVMKSAQDGA